MMPAAKSVGAMEREIVWQAWCGAAKVLNGGVTQESRDRKILNKLLGHYAQGAKSESEKFMRTTRKVYAVKDVVDCINAMVECGVHVTGAGLVATLIDDFIDGSKAWPDVYWQPKKQRDSRAITERRDELRRMSKEQDEIARGV